MNARGARLAAVVVVALGIATGCGGSGGSNSSSSSSSDDGVVSVAAGKTVFADNCTSCHTLADAGSSGSVGPNLDDLKPDDATVANQVTNGGGGMPAFGGQLSDSQIQSVAKYVSSVAGQTG